MPVGQGAAAEDQTKMLGIEGETQCDVNAVMKGRELRKEGPLQKQQWRRNTRRRCIYIRAAAYGDLISFVQLSQAG